MRAGVRSWWRLAGSRDGWQRRLPDVNGSREGPAQALKERVHRSSATASASRDFDCGERACHLLPPRELNADFTSKVADVLHAGASAGDGRRK